MFFALPLTNSNSRRLPFFVRRAFVRREKGQMAGLLHVSGFIIR